MRYAAPMNVSDLGEFGLIERLRRSLPPSDAAQLVVGIGDDAAVWRNASALAVATTDTMVAGVHFLPGRVPWRDVGWKALAVNISDIAAMGGTPSFALVTLCLPGDMALDAIDELYAGIRDCAEKYGVTVAGGDIVSAPVFAITIALTGEAATLADGHPLLLRRDTARVGDVIAVTGPLGGSAAGLRLLLEGADVTPENQSLIARHMRPQPRVAAGREAIDAGIRCAIDISDGLAQDLGHSCAASGVDAELWLPKVRVDPAAEAAFGEEVLALAVNGGEDYELILIAPEHALAATEMALGTPLFRLGRIITGTGVVHALDAHSREVPLPSPGWDHFAPHAPS